MRRKCADVSHSPARRAARALRRERVGGGGATERRGPKKRRAALARRCPVVSADSSEHHERLQAEGGAVSTQNALRSITAKTPPAPKFGPPNWASGAAARRCDGRKTTSDSIDLAGKRAA